MDNQSQQIIDYVRQHLAQGFSETDIRAHLATSGWPQEAINQAFAQYHNTQGAPTPVAPPRPTVSSSLQQAHKSKSSLGKRIIIGTAVLVVGIVVLFLILAASPKTPKTLDKLATPALETNSQNTERENDVAMLAGAISTYESNNQNALPQSTAADASPKTLDICGTSCTATTKSTVQLDYYANTPATTSLRSYATNLTVPDTQTIYIVPYASCKSDKSGIGTAAPGQYVVAILYALQSGKNTEQRCLQD